ncbi:MAG: peptidylprolyl isomerase [Clostridia bacterium]|nr:peptidylprolyl isomerase [Clostridia bacterium]
MKKILLLLLSVLLIAGIFSGCSEKNVYEGDVYAELKLESGESIVMQLFPDVAPMTVKHFIENIEEKYYDGKVFHRAIKGFMIQGGSADGNGVGGSGRTVKGEFKSNGIENNLKHTRGVVSMARTSDPDSGSGQFFIMHAKASHLDGQYAAFGKVVEGMDVVDKIAEMPVGGPNGDALETKPVIESIRIIDDYTPKASAGAASEATSNN